VKTSSVHWYFVDHSCVD